jgi:hypothetical protein
VYVPGIFVLKLSKDLQSDVRKLLTEFNAAAVYTHIDFNYGIFCQMLAKIAHSYAVAELGVSTFAPLLLDLILKADELDAANFVGGFIGTDEKFTLFDGTSPHELLLHNSDGTVIVLIQLSADLGAPVYQVAVGTLIQK